MSPDDAVAWELGAHGEASRQWPVWIPLFGEETGAPVPTAAQLYAAPAEHREHPAPSVRAEPRRWRDTFALLRRAPKARPAPEPVAIYLDPAPDGTAGPDGVHVLTRSP